MNAYDEWATNSLMPRLWFIAITLVAAINLRLILPGLRAFLQD